MSSFSCLGLDLSLSLSAYAHVSTDTDLVTGLLPTTARNDDLARIRSVRGFVFSKVIQYKPDLVVLEGLAYGSVTGHATTRAGMWWSVVDKIDDAGLKYEICPPTMLKKFATGHGNASKDKVMLATAREFPTFDGDNNEADALWAATYGAMILGCETLVKPNEYRRSLVRR